MAARLRSDPVAVTVRLATAADARALERLAALDSGSVPNAPVLVAEVGGELAAAVPAAGGRALADPFRPTADLVRLLARAASLGRGGRTPRRTLGIRRPRWRRAAPAVSSR